MEDEAPAAEPAAEPVTTARNVGRVIRIALLTALILNTAGFIRAGLGMPDGPARSLILGIGRPVDAVAKALDLNRPRQSLDAALGHPDGGVGGKTRLEQEAANVPSPPSSASAPADAGSSASAPVDGTAGLPGSKLRAAPVAATGRHASKDDPLRILVTGDSLSDFDGQQLAKIVSVRGLPAKVRNEPRNGTGLTQPKVFDWASEAASDAESYAPDVVVMVLGANDGWPLVVNGHGTTVGSAAWVAEYTRRIEAVTKEFEAGDPDRSVYWVGPPVPRSSPWIHIFARINDAIRGAATTTPGLRYVDVATPTASNGAYTDYLVSPTGTRVLARQRDGIHFTYEGSVFPAKIILADLEAEFPLD